MVLNEKIDNDACQYNHKWQKLLPKPILLPAQSKRKLKDSFRLTLSLSQTFGQVFHPAANRLTLFLIVESLTNLLTTELKAWFAQHILHALLERSNLVENGQHARNCDSYVDAENAQERKLQNGSIYCQHHHVKYIIPQNWSTKDLFHIFLPHSQNSFLPCELIYLINIDNSMIVLPWFVRFALDCTVVLTPIVYMHYHPSTLPFEYFQNRRRIVRRQSFEEFEHLNTEAAIDVAQVKALYQELGIEA